MAIDNAAVPLVESALDVVLVSVIDAVNDAGLVLKNVLGPIKTYALYS